MNDIAVSQVTRRGAHVHLNDIARSFGDKSVLGSVSLDVKPGEFVAIIGQSGSGKSTLLRIIAGLDQAFEGQLTVTSHHGRAVSRIMYQEPRLLPWARVIENVAFGLGPSIDHHEKLTRARKVLDSVGLGERGAEWPAILSGGQKQRIALARALISQPDLRVLDEPLGALDALTRIEMQSFLEQVWKREGFTSILVTHDVAEALTLADRIVLIEDGAIGLTIDVPFERPRRRGSVQLGILEEKILTSLLRTSQTTTDYMI